jgi:hypothetical protein
MVVVSLALARLIWRGGRPSAGATVPGGVRWYLVARMGVLAVFAAGVLVEAWSKDVGATVSSVAFVVLLVMSLVRLPFMMRARRRRIAANRRT